MPRTDAAAVLGPDNSVYLLGGNSVDVHVLAAGVSAWGLGEPIDKERVALGAGATPEGQVLLFGGQNGGEAIEETYRYDPWSGNSDDGAAMSTTRAHAAYAADPQSGSIFVFGGVDQDGTLLSSVEVYDSAADSWTSLRPLPSARANFAAAADGAGHIFTFGGRRAGYGSNDVTNHVYRYDVTSDSWAAVAPLPAALRDVTAVAGPNNGRIYVIGGRASTGPVASVYAYDFVNNAWEVETSLPTAVSDAAATLDAEGRVLVLGGRNALEEAVATVQVTQDLDAVGQAPTFVSTPTTAATATVPYSYQVIAIGHPQPVFELAVAPAGMLISAGGLIRWTPEQSQIGPQAVTVRALNSTGAMEQSYSIEVASAFPTIVSAPLETASTGAAYVYDVNATGAPEPTYTLTQAPAGMTITSGTGVISWTPTASQAGDFAVTVVAENSLGSNQQSFTVVVADEVSPTQPTLAVRGVGDTSISLRWKATTDNVGVTEYRVYEQFRYGWRMHKTGYRLLQGNISGISTTLMGLTSGRTYKLAVTAVDAAGNESVRSNVVTATTLRAPTIDYSYGATNNAAVRAVANHAMPSVRIYATGVPAPTVFLVSGPTGMTFDALTRVATWTPSDDQVGTHTATFLATNSQGSATLSATITVSANLPVPSKTFSYFGTTYTTPFAVEGDPFELQLHESYSSSVIAWSLASGPSEMNVDPATGVVTWTPTAADVGTANVVFRATNYAGSSDLPVSLTVHPIGTDLRPPAPVSGISVNVIDYNRASVTWAPSTDNAGIESYRITAYYTYYSRGSRTVRTLFTAPGDATMFEMNGLPSRALKLYIQAIDASGNASPVGQVVSFTPVANPDFPSIKAAYPLPTVVAGQPVEIQVTDSNPTPRAYSLTAAPAGVTVDSETGLISWTPGYASVGNATITIRATNEFGYRDLTVTVPVYFTGAVRGVAYVRTGTNAATAFWTPPADTSRIAGYDVKQTWSVNGHTYTRTYKVDSATATSLEGIYIVSGPVVHRVTVTAVDELGNLGAPYQPSVFLA